ncbi:MAG TPA: phage tail protein [Actinomycetota bacterium]|nr:phage tail protein [Actinomycetota bacterium]
MRGAVRGMASPQPLGFLLPPIYYEDSFTQRITAGLDEVLAPVFLALDNLDAYLSPAVAPPDFLEWLAGWVGVVLDETWSLERRRALVGEASALYAQRGTVRGLVGLVRLVFGGDVEVEESGAAAWSPVPNGDLPGTAEPSLKVRVRVADAGVVDRQRLEAVVSSGKPAHIPHQIEVVTG